MPRIFKHSSYIWHTFHHNYIIFCPIPFHGQESQPRMIDWVNMLLWLTPRSWRHNSGSLELSANHAFARNDNTDVDCFMAACHTVDNARDNGNRAVKFLLAFLNIPKTSSSIENRITNLLMEVLRNQVGKILLKWYPLFSYLARVL